jgi:hypothetical protein
METKSAFSGIEVKSASRGEVEAVFSTFNVIDKDGDVTFPGAFTDGEEVVISQYGHEVWKGGLPVGLGRIRPTQTEAILQGQFFMNTTEGRNHFEVVRAMGPRQEWSYGFDVLHPPESGTFRGRKANFLKKLKVHEVSPVFKGAGVNTRTLALKALLEGGLTPEEAVLAVSATEYAAAIRPHETRVTTKRWDHLEVVQELPDDATVDDLRAVHAHVNPNADPTAKASYRFPHHHGPRGDANLRACLTQIALLNGAKGATDLSEAERLGVYNHLAQHLADGDRDVPELRTEASGSLKFHEEAAATLASLDSLIVRTSEVMALRRSKGKAIAPQTVDTLEWVYDDMRRLRALLDSPQEDADREYARFVQSLLQNPGA